METIKRIKKRRSTLLAALLMATVVFVGGGALFSAKAAPDDLLYRLDFSDANAIGKNIAGTDFADATLQSGATVSITDGVKGGKALNFVGGNDGKNYLSLPTAIFEGQNAVTLSGWFYAPHDIGDYIGEIGIYAPEYGATFRADPRAGYHWDAYLYDVGKKKDIPGGSTCGVKPVYDTWYHMAYVIDGAAHTFTVIQNGAKVYEETLDSAFTPSQYHSDTSHFYLGQSAYETDKDNYTGKMADFRVYGKALTAQEVADAYALDVTDFKTAEYTFDNAENRYEDSVRGYDLQDFNGTPTFVDGGIRLEGGAAVQPYVRDNDNAANAKNIHFFDGHANLTISMDLTVKSNEAWRRVMDMFASGDNRITYMWHCPRAPGDVFDAVYHAKDAGSEGDANDNNMIGDNSFAFRLNEKFNLTIVLSDDEITVWENGAKKSPARSAINRRSKSFIRSSLDKRRKRKRAPTHCSKKTKWRPTKNCAPCKSCSSCITSSMSTTSCCRRSNCCTTFCALPPSLPARATSRWQCRHTGAKKYCKRSILLSFGLTRAGKCGRIRNIQIFYDKRGFLCY